MLNTAVAGDGLVALAGAEERVLCCAMLAAGDGRLIFSLLIPLRAGD